MCVRSYYLLFTEIVIEWIVVRPVHGLGQFSFGPNPDSTFWRRVEGGRTRNQPPLSIGRVSFRFECGRFQFSWSLETAFVAGNCKNFAQIYKF